MIDATLARCPIARPTDGAVNIVCDERTRREASRTIAARVGEALADEAGGPARVDLPCYKPTQRG